MNREALLELAERIEGNAWMMRRFLHDPDIGSVECAVEILGRIGIIEGKLAQLRKELAQPDDPASEAEAVERRIRLGTHQHNVHTLGAREPSYRPHGSDAA